jgi:hypothetical protein
MCNQMHLASPGAPLSELLQHPEFLEGLTVAQQHFLDSYEEAPLTEEEMIDEVERHLSRRITEHRKHACRALGWEPPPSYLYTLGFVLGIINTGLTYAR